jgi:hypothetical protein
MITAMANGELEIANLAYSTLGIAAVTCGGSAPKDVYQDASIIPMGSGQEAS